MFSARTLLRAPAARFTSSLTRSLVTKPRPVIQATWKPIALPRARAFSCTPRAFEKQGAVDEELAVKLHSELEMEKEMNDSSDYPVSVKDYLRISPFKVNDTPGKQEVELVRKYGDETIRVTFSIADLHQFGENEMAEDETLYDENPDAELSEGRGSMQSGGAQSKPAKERMHGNPVDPAAEGSEFENTGEEEEDAEEDTAFPTRVTITIEKPNHGALLFETIAQDGMFVIDNVYHHSSASLALAKTAEADWARRGVYGGPPFGNLDEDLQMLFERYLDERGVNTALALFVPDYVEHKEQKEYLSWLEGVRSFVEA